MRRKHYLIRAGGLVRKQQVSLGRKALQDIRDIFVCLFFNLWKSFFSIQFVEKAGFCLFLFFDQISVLTGRWRPEQ